MNDCITPRLSPQEREEREAYFASQKLREQRAESLEPPPSVSLLDLLDQAQAEQRRLTATLAARDERVRELEAEVQRLRERVAGMEGDALVCLPGVCAARIASLERELAEARPIVQAARLYYQAELAGNEKGMLAGLRAIQAAFERGTIADHARRMAPAEDHRKVVEPAPAPAQRWRCEECGETVRVAGDHRGPFVPVHVMDAKPAAPAPARYRCEECGWEGTEAVRDMSGSGALMHLWSGPTGQCGPVVPFGPARAADGEAG